MKKIITLLLVLTSSLIFAQSRGINYQAVVYNPSAEILPGNNNNNAVMANKDVCLRFTILDGSGVAEYQETQQVKTDEFGMVNLLIGTGNKIGGYAATFKGIAWNSNTKNLKVDIDPSKSCSNFVEISNQEFAGVPYAYAADTVTGIVAIENGGTGATTAAGAKANLGLDKIDNTSDLDKPVSNATQAALNLKEDKANKSTNTALGTSDVLYPTQNAVKTYVDSQITNVSISDATTTAKGKIQLAGDLGGTAAAPTVPGLATKEPIISAGTATQYYRGDKTWQTLDAAAVGLGNVSNVADADKPVSNAVITALAGKEDVANKSNNVALGTSSTLYPTQNAVKTYVDGQIASAVANVTVSDATATAKGVLKLTNELGGTADAPTISNDAVIAKTLTGFTSGAGTISASDSVLTAIQKADGNLAAKAPLADPTFTGTPKAPTATAGDSSTQIATTAFVGTAVTNAVSGVTVNNATTTSLGKIQLGGDLAGTGTSAVSPTITDGAITTAKLANNAVLNTKIGEIIAVNKGGTGSDMSGTSIGYVKQATQGANFTTVTSIPVTDVTGAVRSVNGVVPGTNGNVAVILGRVFTGSELDPSTAASILALPASGTLALKQSDIYIVVQTGNPNNGRTFIYDGSTWIEVASDLSTSDARYVNVTGDTMEGNLTIPTNKKILIADEPTNATEAANKAYVDKKVDVASGSGTTNFVSKFSDSNTLADSLIFDNGTTVAIGTTTPSTTPTSAKLEIKGDANASGLRFTNLTSGSTAGVPATKVLSVNTVGDVVLTNVAGTQVIVSFDKATPTTTGVAFSPNQPQDPNVIYRSSVDKSLWTWDTTLSTPDYVTYVPPATTEWKTASTTNDAGSDKTGGIWRDGKVAIGATNDNPTNNLDVLTSFSLRSAKGGNGSKFGMEMQADGTSDTRLNWVASDAYVAEASSDGIDFNIKNLKNSTNSDINFFTNVGGTSSAKMTLTNDGSLGIGTTTPTKILDVINPSASHKGIIEAEGPVSSLVSRAFAIRMRRGTFSVPTSIKKDDISVYAVSGYDGSSFSTTAAGFGGIATEDWSATAKGMGLLFLTTNNGTTTVNERMRIAANGNVGIGTIAPANKLEITHGTTGNSGLRFTNLKSTDAAVTSSSKVLTVNTSGDVELTNVPGTQAVVSFTTATPTTTGVVFTPNTPTDSSVIYQSDVDNSMWTYNPAVGATPASYVTYTPPSTTEWKLAKTTVDAGSNKTSAIWREGNVGIGINGTIGNSTPTNTLDVVGSFQLKNAPGANGTNYGMEFFTNSNAPRIDFLHNGSYVGESTVDPNSFYIKSTMNNALSGINFSTKLANTDGVRMRLSNDGNLGIGTTAPTSPLEVASTNGVTAVVRRGLPSASGQSSTSNIMIQRTSNNDPNLSTALTAGDWIGRLVFSGSNGTTTYPTQGIDIIGYASGTQSGGAAPTGGGGLLFRTTMAGANPNNQSAIRMQISDTGSVAIGGGNLSSSSTGGADPSAILDVSGQLRNPVLPTTTPLAISGSFTYKGFLPPRVPLTSTTDVTTVSSLSNTAAGLLIYNTATAATGTATEVKPGYYYYNGAGTWIAIGSSTTAVNVQSGAYTLASTDNKNIVVINSATDVTVTVPTGLSPGFFCQIIQKGAGRVTLASASGVAMNSAIGFKTRTQFSSIGVVMETSTTGYVSGDSSL